MTKVLGLDIGISSVGWGIIDIDNGTIIDAGVRLFEEATRNANEERRNFRGTRRVIRRRSHRLERAKKLFQDYQLPVSGIGKVDPYLARYNAIYNKVTKEELVAGLYHIVKRRGTVLDSPEEDEKNRNELSTKEQLSRNKKLLENKYICEIQLERLKNGSGKIRNHENRFRTEDYVNEARAILLKQQQMHPEISNEFIEKFIELIQKRRQYFEGPGSKKSPTKYGRYYIDKNGNISYMSMIDKMRGKCTYFPDEPRVAKMAITAELFDWLNGDLNKLMINGEYLTYEDKLYLFEQIIKKGKNLTLKQILKYKGVSDDADVRGYRIDLKSNKPIFTVFAGYKEILKTVKEYQLPEQILDNFDLMDEIADVLSSEKSFEQREKRLAKLFSQFNRADRQKIIDAFKHNTKFKGYHTLSKKAMLTILDDLWHTNKNQMELFWEYGLEQKRFSNSGNQKYIKFDDSAILSTVAKRAHREAIKIVNEVRKKYGEMDAIAIETAREKNSDEKRKRYKDFQKQVGKHEKEMAKLLGVKSLEELNLNSKQHLALKLWASQDGKCMYSGKRISVQDIVSNPFLFEIDHILPISISFDDSQANKVLCYHQENQLKGQRTPYQYFQSGKASRTFDQFKVEVLNLFNSKKISNKKKEYLLELRDIQHNEDLQREFINRNLVDTRYASRSFSMTLRSFFRSNHINTKVFSIKGSFTAAVRRRARLDKDREKSHAHHAIDALIVAAVAKMPVFEYFREFDMNENGVVFNKKTGEILKEEDFYRNRFITFIRNLMNYESKVKYSHKVDRKVNRILSDQTIYGTRKKEGETYYLGKYSDIYNLDKNSIKPVLSRLKKHPDSFLIAQHNPDLFQHILKIVKEYAEEENPFKAYYNDHGYILKDGKVPVKQLRYYEKKLGNHIKITDKYPKAKNDVVLLRIKSLRIDVYKNKEGIYKYIGVPYYWFKQQGDYYVLDMKKYNDEKMQSYKNIDDSFEFQFSLYRNDRFSYEKNGENYERILIGDNNSRKNIIELDYVDKKKDGKERLFLTFSTINNIVKYNTDVLGNTYIVKKENFKDTLQLL
ncbi:type II CRISPR RNA-guided endonuclease Cas9 [Fervidibacillus albus]|uniref:CRISPR-associated endonuclease Cas9 n=1 Tax=Fervidibacillus albus TaxID=2980026 RepID=A0A9E8LUJ6_9BACI|nr:type II CRISPR RNA-guided endonuclease Cas9 [Fervidibacillus albus]WAA09859.1 type II CRISPR RNA-guided endonuclease Cas9 [Fervidibacillus albus]